MAYIFYIKPTYCNVFLAYFWLFWYVFSLITRNHYCVITRQTSIEFNGMATSITDMIFSLPPFLLLWFQYFFNSGIIQFLFKPYNIHGLLTKAFSAWIFLKLYWTKATLYFKVFIIEIKFVDIYYQIVR